MGNFNKLWEKLKPNRIGYKIIVFVLIFVFLAYLLIRLLNTNSKLPNTKEFLSLKENISNYISPNSVKKISDNEKPIALIPSSAVDNVSNEIKMIYPTKQNGRVWEAKWSNEKRRTVVSGDRDPFDSEFIVRGNGNVTIDGDGLAQMSGDAPRMYIYDRAKKKKWKNVEVTVYAKRGSESKNVSYQGIVIGARSEHQDATRKKPCNGQTYYGRLLYDGRAVFQKEVVHEGAYSSNKPRENNKVSWDTPNGTMPKNEWIGLKFIVKSDPKNKSVKLELYRDLTDGLNGGAWEKVAEYTDKGKWSQTNSGINIVKKCGYSASKVLLKPGTSVFIRNDYIDNAQYKYFSIREID